MVLAVFLIITAALALAFEGEVLDLKELGLAAMAFLFGRASGESSAKLTS